MPAPRRKMSSKRRSASCEICGLRLGERRLPFYSRHRSSPLHEKLIEPVGGKAEEGDGEHDGIHAFIGASRAEIADQIAEALLRHDQFGRHQKDEGQRQRSADAVEQFRQRARQHDVPDHAQAAGAHAARRPDQRMIAAARAVIGADGHRDHAAEKNQQNLRAIAEAEPQYGHRNERGFRQRIKQLDQRINEHVDDARARHGDAEAAADDDGKQKPDGAAIKR